MFARVHRSVVGIIAGLRVYMYIICVEENELACINRVGYFYRYARGGEDGIFIFNSRGIYFSSAIFSNLYENYCLFVIKLLSKYNKKLQGLDNFFLLLSFQPVILFSYYNFDILLYVNSYVTHNVSNLYIRALYHRPNTLPHTQQPP